MTTLSDDIDTFKTGDIIITQRNTGSPVYHTTLFIEAQHSDLGVRSFVHAGPERTEIRPAEAYADDVTGPYRRYQRLKPSIGEATAIVAQRWATHTSPYGSRPSSQLDGIPGKSFASRYYGMTATGALTEIPFELSALLRVFKWVLKFRRNMPISEKRGITCCAFITACTQTALMNMYFEKAFIDDRVISDAYQNLIKEMQTKSAARKQAPLPDLRDTNDVKKGYVGQALRANSNRQTLDTSELHGQTLDQQWEVIKHNFLNMYPSNLRNMALSDIFQPLAVFYDVKYMNTKLMENALAQQNAIFKDYTQW